MGGRRASPQLEVELSSTQTSPACPSRGLRESACCGDAHSSGPSLWWAPQLLMSATLTQQRGCGGVPGPGIPAHATPLGLLNLSLGRSWRPSNTPGGSPGPHGTVSTGSCPENLLCARPGTTPLTSILNPYEGLSRVVMVPFGQQGNRARHSSHDLRWGAGAEPGCHPRSVSCLVPPLPSPSLLAYGWRATRVSRPPSEWKPPEGRDLAVHLPPGGRASQGHRDGSAWQAD